MSIKNTPPPRRNVRDLISDQAAETVLAFTTPAALRAIIAELKPKIEFALICHRGGENVNILIPTSRSGALNHLMQNPDIAQLVAAQAALQILEASEVCRAAAATFNPLLEELAALVEIEQAELREQSAKNAKRNAALAKIDAAAELAKAELAET